jgi:iron only hydrogenase large subunit-like protein
MIISRCPGAVLFFERKTKYAAHLAQLKPFPHLFSQFAKRLDNRPYVVSVVPCYDRKLETGRFSGDVDAVLTIGEISNDLDSVEAAEESVSFPPDSDVLSILKELAGSSQVVRKEIGQTIEYHVGKYTGAFICGEAALRRFCANMDRGKNDYDIVEANFCPNGCFSGGGLIRGSNPRERKAMVERTIEIHKSVEKDGCASEIEKMVERLTPLEISASYVSVAKGEKPDFDF